MSIQVPPPSRHDGFTLVELAIVLVIIGLIIGGIMVGASLIEAAQIRSVMSDIDRYKAGAATFRDKYFALPGDMVNATDFFGTSANTCPMALGSPAAAGTCNGNGDGLISGVPEFFLFWQQLSLAGLIPGAYTGVGTTAGVSHAKPGVNVPITRMKSAGFLMIWGGPKVTVSSTAALFSGDYGNEFQLGTEWPLATSTTNCYYALTPQQAYTIDSKYDDGLPATGWVVANLTTDQSVSAIFKPATLCLMNSSNGAINFTDATDPADAAYNISNTAIACALVFKKAF